MPQWLKDLISYIEIPVMLGAFIYIGRKLQILDSLEASMEKVKHNVKVVSDYLTKHYSQFDPRELKTMSPVTLTSEGYKFVEDIGFTNVFEKNKNDFFQYIDGEQPKLKYEVESAAIKSIYVLSDKEYMAFLKVYLYNHPNRLLENTAPTLGIYVRDKYLAIHPEITQ